MNFTGKRLSDCMSGISSNVNILKFVCAILVIFCHSYPIVNGTNDILYTISGISNFGGVAVAVFFFYSGFYVSKSLDRHKNIVEYIRVRCIRIFPGLAIVVLISILFYGPIFTTMSIIDYYTNKGTLLYLANIFFIPIHNLPGVFENAQHSTINGSLWTMAVEIVCYIILLIGFVICKHTRKINHEKLSIFSVVCLIIFFVVVFYGMGKDCMLVSVIRPMILFAIGVSMYIKRDKIILNVKIALMFLLICFISVFIGLLNYAIIFLLPYVVMTFTLGVKQYLPKVKVFSLSYEMYLVGWPIQQAVLFVFNRQMSPILNFIISVPLDIVIAYGISKMVLFIERKLQKIEFTKNN